MIIDISPIQEKLDIVEDVVGRQEYSGFGWIIKVDKVLKVYDFKLLHVGSEGFTDIKPERIIPLISRSDNQNMRLWIHKHPVGTGKPGPNNWSGVDHATCTETPMGGIPEMIKWSAAIVHTPRGWVGRVDNHLKEKTFHIPVATFEPWRIENQATVLLEEYYASVHEDAYDFGDLEEYEDGSFVQAALDWVRSKV